MNLELTAEQEELRSTVRRCLAEEASIGAVVRPLTRGGPWAPDGSWRSLADMGAFSLLVPPTGGGLGLGMTEAAIVAREMGRALYPGPWLPSAVLAVRALSRVGGGAVDRHFKEIIGGSTVYTCAVAAPLGIDGPDIAVVGDTPPLVDGRAPFVVGGARADVFVIPADDGGSPALCTVEAGAPGVVVRSLTSIDAAGGDASVSFQRAPASIVGRLGRDGLQATGDDALVAMGADALGAASAVLEIALEHAKTRYQFGRPIGAFQAVQHLCVEMYETVELASGGVFHAAWAADAGDPEARHLSALRLKSFSDRAASVADAAIQVLGGIGFTWEHDAHLYLRRLLRWSAFLGPPSSYRVELGRLVATARQGSAGVTANGYSTEAGEP